MTKHYIAILDQNDAGEWRALFPDAPGCEAKGFTLDDVEYAATSALARYMDKQSVAPTPMDMDALARRDDWLKQNQVDLTRVVVTVIPLSV